MDVTQPLALLGGLSPAQFMKRHWQKKPLLVRQAVPGIRPLLDRKALFALAGQDDVESRLVVQSPRGWKFRHGPLRAHHLPPLKQPLWTLLVQGVDQHADAVHSLLQRFRFVPDARLDDLMISYATDGGGVGPHFDSYDVFLLQVHGKRRWKIGAQKDLTLRDGVPLKILANFQAEQEWVLEPGDMLYLPPRYAHDGIAVGECMTYSIGFRAPRRSELVRELLVRLADESNEGVEEGNGADDVGAGSTRDPLYRDAGQPAVPAPAAIPDTLHAFARDALASVLADPAALSRVLGEYLTEPKANVWFESGGSLAPGQGVCLDRRTRMHHDAAHVFINGEAFRASGRDAALMRQLADMRRLSARELGRASTGARELMGSWCEAGWLHGE